MAAIPRPNPKLMVLGDSFPQGCRSYSVTRAYCAQSWPARYAAARGIEFVPPDFPRPVLFDLETLIRRLDPVENVLDRQTMRGYLDELVGDYNAWMANAASTGPAAFDNLAVAGTVFADIGHRTAATCQADIDRFAAKFGATLPDRQALLRLALHPADLRSLHLAVNARYVLNPTNDPAFQNLSSLDWVKARKPETLVVHAGHNYGLYAVGGEAAGGAAGSDPITADGFLAEWEELAGELAALPADTTRIYVGGLPKVGAAANLRPLADGRTDGYADEYEPTFGVSTRRLTGARLKELDAAVKAATARMKQILEDKEKAVGTAGRSRFVDVYGIVEEHDFKNSLDAAKRLDAGGPVPLDNRYLESQGLFRRELSAGGLQTIDGMHLSGVGYALIACAVLKAEGSTADPAAILRRAFADDRLLSSPPRLLGTVVAAFREYRDAVRAHPEAARQLEHVLAASLPLDGDVSLVDVARFLAAFGR